MNMVQPIEQLSPRRRRTRALRTRRYLKTASKIVFTEGLDALTMQRVAKELDCAVGTIYRYFPSKDALVADLQREAIEAIIASYHIARPGWDTQIDARTTADAAGEQTAALAGVVIFGRFYAGVPETYPEEFHLLRGLVGDPRSLAPGEDAQRVMPSAMALLEIARHRLATAARAEALTDADHLMRAVLWVVTLTGAINAGELSRFDPTIFDADGLSTMANLDLLRGWGADPEQLEMAADIADNIAELGPVAPEIPRDIERLT